MADVKDFIIPESNFGGVHRAADSLERKSYRDSQEKSNQAAKKATSAAFLSNYLNPKDNLTGTAYDPEIVKGFDELMQQGIKLATEGADQNMMMMALAPGVAKLNQYSTSAKLVNQRVKEQLANIPANAGYDKQKLEELAKRVAFYGEDGKLKDISTLDPQTDWLSEVIKRHPDQVTTDAAIDEFVKSSPKYTNTKKVKRINSKGGYELKNAKVTAPSWAVVDDEGNIVPRFDIALEDGQPQTYDFNGKVAPIRLMNEKDFDSLMSSNPGIADWVRGQLMRTGQGTNLATPQAKNAARAIMYDELKRRGGGGIEDIEETKANPAPRITINNSSGSSKGDLTINDVYGSIDEKTNDPRRPHKSVPINELSEEEGAIVLKIARDREGNDITQADIFVRKDSDNVIRIYGVDGRVVAPLSRTGTNIKTQPSVKEKREVIKQGNKNSSKPKSDPLGIF